jgi:hypothetical protein
VDGITAVQLRINDLRAKFEPRPVSPSTSSGATTGTTSTLSPSSTGATTSTAFADALAAAQRTASNPANSTSSAGVATPTDTGSLKWAARLTPGQYGSLQPPAELAGYGNGKVPADALASIGGEHRLYAPAAGAFTKMSADARAQGVTIGVNESYRDLGEQQRLAGQLGLYSQGGKAAAPGTSNHGWGLALDLQLDPKAQQWMRDNAYKYGFAEDVAREPWHWTYRPAS